MKRKTLFLLTLVAAMLTLSNVRVSAASTQVLFEVGYIDPGNTQDEPQRNPTTVPTVEIEDNILTFVTPCDGLELRLVNEENGVEFTTVISGTTLVLPSYLSGDYQLQIISGSYVFYGGITL